MHVDKRYSFTSFEHEITNKHTTNIYCLMLFRYCRIMSWMLSCASLSRYLSTCNKNSSSTWNHHTQWYFTLAFVIYVELINSVQLRIRTVHTGWTNSLPFQESIKKLASRLWTVLQHESYFYKIVCIATTTIRRFNMWVPSQLVATSMSEIPR